MLYERFKTAQTIIKQGDESNNKLYIILSGKVAIVTQKDRNVYAVDNQKTEEQKKEELTKKKLVRQDTIKNLKLAFQKNSANSIEQLNEIQEQYNLEDIIDSYGTKVNEMEKGNSFGHLALTATNPKVAPATSGLIKHSLR